LNPTPTTREFHASFPSHESARRQAARLRKSNAQTKRVEDARKAKESRPHPALGYAPGNESLWKDSKLCKLLVTEETVRQLPVPSLEMEMVPEIVRVKGPHGRFLYDHKNDRPETETTGRMVPKVAEGWPVVLKHGTPQLLNYGVGNSEMDMIKKVSFLRPAASLIRLEDAEAHRETQQRVEGKGAVWSGDQTSLEQILEQHKWQTSRETNLQYWFGRLIDLKNASAQGLEFENKMRIVAAFSSQGKPHDPGLPEVQGTSVLFSVIEAHSYRPRSCSQDISHPRSVGSLANQEERHSKSSPTSHDDSRTSQDTSLPPENVQSAV